MHYGKLERIQVCFFFFFFYIVESAAENVQTCAPKNK